MSEQKRRLWENDSFEQNEDDDGIFSSLTTKDIFESYPANESTNENDTDYEKDEE